MADTAKTQYESSGASSIRMRPSRVLRKIREGGVASCFKLNGQDPRMVEIAAMCGIDCVWLCTEHVPTNYADMENMIRAAKLYDVDTVVRVPRGSYSDHIRGLEMDAAGIMVPHVMSKEDAANVVRMTKFPPIGRRAVDGGNADGGYCLVDFLDYLETANCERFVICQIEDPEVMPDLEAIAEMPGVDMLLFGPGDFSVALGKPGQLNDQEVVAARKRVAKVARDAGKIAGTVGTIDTLPTLASMGYNFINCLSDVFAIKTFVTSVSEAFGKL